MTKIKDIQNFAKTIETRQWLKASKKAMSFPNHDVALFPFQKNALTLLSIQTPQDLSRLLTGSHFYRLENNINQPAYKKFEISKKKGGKRIIYAPSNELKSIQKKLNYYLQAYYLWIKPQEAHGFVINPKHLASTCNIVENAKAHVKKKVLLNIDLQDFFPSISAGRVKAIFSSSLFNFDDQLATALTLLSTYDGKLIIGAPTSPVISNFICIALDDELITYCKSNSLAYSRYADDLTFSSQQDISKEMLAEIRSIIEKNKFKINEKKLRVRSSNRKQTVTGLTVNEKVNVDRKLLKKVRAMIFDLEKNGLESAAKNHFKKEANPPDAINYFLNKLRGYVDFIGQVKGKDDLVYLKYKSLFSLVIS